MLPAEPNTYLYYRVKINFPDLKLTGGVVGEAAIGRRHLEGRPFVEQQPGRLPRPGRRLSSLEDRPRLGSLPRRLSISFKTNLYVESWTQVVDQLLYRAFCCSSLKQRKLMRIYYVSC